VKIVIETYLQHHPRVDPTAWIHSTAVVIGEVRLGPRVSIWPTAVLRGDDGSLEVQEDSNIQDGAVLHNTGGLSVTVVGPRVTVGHRAILHGCRIESDCIIGMGAIVMDNAVVGRGCIVGAGTLITMGTVIPPDTLVLGSPGRPVRATTPEDLEWIRHSWTHYVDAGRTYRGASEPLS
jgi:carbonic anhydrase/acetyltransferase-like protein (isoleucine patch superfamily)